MICLGKLRRFVETFQLCQTFFIWPLLASFCLFLLIYTHNLTEKAVDLSKIRTGIVRVEGERVTLDHHLATTIKTSEKVFESFGRW